MTSQRRIIRWAWMPALVALAGVARAQPADPAFSGFLSFDPAVVAGGVDSGQLIAQLRSSQMLPVPGHTVAPEVVSAPFPSAITFMPPSAVTNASGQAAFTVRSTAVQAATIRLRDVTQGNQPMSITAFVTFTNQGRIYVDAAASGTNTGTSWQNAFTSLQAALTLAAGAGSSGVSQIWVANGVYIPGPTATATFALRNNLAIYGGFAGNEALLSQRNPMVNLTTLSGEISSPSINDNVAHVVTAANVGNTAVLDGFIITRGNAAYSANLEGGGIHLSQSTPTIANCLIRENRASSGGGVYISGSAPSFANCLFELNSAFGGAGGLGQPGGAALSVGASNPSFTNCTFRSNTATGQGGGIAITQGDAALLSCLFLTNSVGANINSFGGAIAILDGGTVRITNCTVRSNSTARNDGAGGLDHRGGALAIVRNSIFWQNTSAGVSSGSAQIFVVGSPLDITYSTVQNGAFAGTCNNSSDPLFSDSDGRLSATSPMIDTGTLAVGQPPLPAGDIESNARVIDVPARPSGPTCIGTVDRGAYEYSLRRCVKAGNAPSGPGTTWDNAFATLQEGLSAASTAGGTITQLWVATGTYTPSLLSNPPDPRSATFVMQNNLSILGGYFGTPETDANRDPAANVTILSGEIGPGGMADNCYHVVTASGVNDTAVLDGMRIEEGNASGTGTNTFGGGLFAVGGSPSIDQCHITGNAALVVGGGAYFSGGAPALANCVFEANTAPGGAALRVVLPSGPFSIANTDFVANVASPAPVSGAFHATDAELMLSDVVFEGNTAPSDPTLSANGELNGSTSTLAGDLVLNDGALTIGPRTPDDTDDSYLFGPGEVQLAATGTLRFGTQSSGNAPVQLEADIVGAGRVELLEHAHVRLDGATIDLSGMPIGAPCLPAAGTLELKGTLRVGAGAVQNCNIIVHNEVTTGTCGKAVGGVILLVDDAAEVRCNDVQAYADGFLRMLSGVSPAIANLNPNAVGVEILYDGDPRAYGELYEYRSPDYHGETGFVQRNASAGYNDDETGTLDELRIRENARLNLVDREADTPGRDVLYVKDVYLYPSARLNVGLGTLYYQRLHILDALGVQIGPDNPAPGANGRYANNADTFDVPLMGFRLGVIKMENDCEFDVRVEPDNGGVASRIRRLPAGDPAVIAAGLGTGGVMEMRTQVAARIAARGAFARVYEDEVTVLFRYLFRTDPSGAPWPQDLATRARIDVYLSDTPIAGGGVRKHLGRIYQPGAGRAGAIGSGRWGVFFARVPRGALNLEEGSFVELELHNPGSTIWIDDFDPLVDCSSGVCYDLDYSFTVDGTDYLISLAAYGEALNPFSSTVRLCLDGLDRDTYVDAADLALGDLQLQYGAGSCVLDPGDAGATSARSWPGGTALLVAGRPDGAASDTSDQLFPITAAGASAGAAFSPPSIPRPGDVYRGNGRLTRDPTGDLYQLHATQGLIRISDGETIIPAQTSSLSYGTLEVYVGPVETAPGTVIGRPILDAAFDPRNSAADPTEYIYVAPVTVETPGGFRYTPAARLRRALDGSVSIDRLYGPDPNDVSIARPVMDAGDVLYTAYEPDHSRTRELDVDARGDLFVVSAQGVGDNDWLLVYNSAGGDPALDDLDSGPDVTYALSAPGGDPDVAAPSALLRTLDDSIYVTSSVREEGAPDRRVRLYRYTIQRGVAGGPVTGIAYSATIDFDFPDHDADALTPQNTAITSLAQTADGTIHVLGFTAPVYEGDVTFAPFENVFTRAVRTTVAAAPAANWLVASNIVLPLAAVSATCPADLDGDGDVDLSDLTLFLSAFGSCSGQAQFRQTADLVPDGCISLSDLTLFLSAFGRPCPGS